MKVFTACFSSPVGNLQIRCTSTTVTSVKFVEHCNEENGHAPLLTLCKEQLEAYFRGDLKNFHFPIQQEGTPFQQGVWKHLIDIPFGKTISYLQLSKTIGDVKAIRAIAAANGRNNLAIVVPCHRVIGSDAKLVGYSGGLWRKKWLLDHEAKYHSGVQQFDF